MNRLRLPFAIACALLASAAEAAPVVAPATRAPTPPARAQAVPAQAPKPADPERVEAAADNLARIRAALKLVLGRAEQARSEKDVVKLNCVNEKLVQIKALLKVAEQADGALRDAIATRKSAGDAEFSKLAIARTKVDGLRRDAEHCVGQLAYLVDEKTTIEVEQPSNLARERDGLGVANRGGNPADTVGEIGSGAPAGGIPCNGPGAFCPPPVVRPPDASPSR